MRRVWITPEDNVRNQVVIDNEKVTSREFTNNDIVTIDDNGRERSICIASISLYDHKLIIGGKKYSILHMLSKGD